MSTPKRAKKPKAEPEEAAAIEELGEIAYWRRMIRETYADLEMARRAESFTAMATLTARVNDARTRLALAEKELGAAPPDEARMTDEELMIAAGISGV